MDIFTFGLTVIVAFLGLLTGSFLSHHARDEVKYIEKYLPFIQLLCLILVFVILYAFMPFFIASCLLVLSFSFIYLFWNKKNMNVLDYIIFAILFSFTSLNFQQHLYMTVVLFLFGVFSGTLYYALHTKPVRQVSHHRHSGKHLSLASIQFNLFHHYSFFLVLSFATFLLSKFLTFIFF